MPEVNSVTFIASLPQIQSAISLDGMGDGARIKLDVPRQYVDAIILLQQYFSGESFVVTIQKEVDRGNDDPGR